MHTLTNIPATPQDQSCTRCGACRRDTGEWWMLGYSRPVQPPCTASLRDIEEWAGVAPKNSAVKVLRAPDSGNGIGGHALRKKW